MTEDFEDFAREERLFSDALRASAEVESFGPLPAGQFTRPRTPGRLAAWGKGIAAAAAAVVVVGGLAAVLWQLGGSATSASLPAEPASGAGGAAAPEAASAAASAQSAEDTKYSASRVQVGEWTQLTTPPLAARSDATGAWLDGKFYLVGGQLDRPCPPNASCLAPTELLRDGASYDPVTDTWQQIADAPVDLSASPPAVVAGRLYYQVGYGVTAGAYAYDAAQDRWSRIATPKGGGALVAAGDRLVSINYSDEVAGFDELYDADADTWTRLPDDPLGKSFNRGAIWVNGKLLLGAHKLVADPGSEEPSLVQLAELDLDTMRWTKLSTLDVLSGFSAAVGGLVIFPTPGSADGGEVNNWGRSYPMGGIYDVGTGDWAELPDGLPSSDGVTRSWGDAAVTGGQVFTSGHLLDPSARTWTELPSPPSGNLVGQTVIAGPEGLLVFGGWDGTAHTGAAHYLPLR